MFYSTSRCHVVHSLAPTIRKIAVIGGGASGIFAAIAAAESNPKCRVQVFEASSKPLVKVSISGGGRCNVLHDTTKPVPDILQMYPRGSRELRGLFSKHFTPTMAREWFTNRGIELKTEQDGRMFPITDKSQTIVSCLLDAAKEANVDIHYKSKIVNIIEQDDNDTNNGFWMEMDSSDNPIHVNAIILATGSSKRGHELASKLGHSIIQPVPSLFTLVATEVSAEDGPLHGLSGIAVPHAQLILKYKVPNRKKKQSLVQEGPLLITHLGISGPATLRLSAFGARILHELSYHTILKINFVPPYHNNSEQVFDQLWQCTTLYPKRLVSSACPLRSKDDDNDSALLPKRLWMALVSQSLLDKKTWSEAPKKNIQTLSNLLCDYELHIQKKVTYKQEFVTAGGIDLKEVNMATLESKLIQNLYIVGEALNIDGVTGGYNFMNCWSTGYMAGKSAAAEQNL